MSDAIPRREIPLLEFDASPTAVINPRPGKESPRLPARCVIAFFGDRVQAMAEQGLLQQVDALGTEAGPMPIYLYQTGGEPVALMQPGIGAPLAAGCLDELWARGCDRFVVCGGCGVLDRDVVVGHLLVPTQALRDEGTSFHYAPPSRWIAPTPAALQAVRDELTTRELPYLDCKTWTNDAFYRETPAKVALRREEGCLAVEMEASALFAAARFRGVELAQVLYAGDDVSGVDWDHRAWNGRHSLREELIYIAIAAVRRL